MSLSLRQIRYFIAAAETGQVSHAAVELNVSQSAVTTAILNLERDLDMSLFTRSPAGVSLTPEGARFLLRARNIMAAVEEAIRMPRSSHEVAVGRLRLGMSYTVAGYFFPRHYVRFARNFPQVEIELFEAQRSEIEEALVDGALDIALMLVSNLRDRERLQSETLIRSQRRLWVAQDHPLLKQRDVRIADVAECPYIMLTVDEAFDTSRRYWAEHGFEPKIVFRTSSVEAVRSMVAAGVGVTILSDMVYRPWSLDGQRIETRRLVDSVPSMDIGFAWARTKPLSPIAQAFHSFLSLSFIGGGHSPVE